MNLQASIELNCNKSMVKCNCLKALADMNNEIEAKRFDSSKIEAKAPAGWEGTVKHMKKHSEITNPWALAYWMKDQGYESHKD